MDNKLHFIEGYGYYLDGKKNHARTKMENVWATHRETMQHLNQPFNGEEPVDRSTDNVRRYPERP